MILTPNPRNGYYTQEQVDQTLGILVFDFMQSVWLATTSDIPREEIYDTVSDYIDNHYGD